MEQRVAHLLQGMVIPAAGNADVLFQEIDRKAQQPQHHAGYQHQFGIQGKAGKTAIAVHIHQNRPADAADHNQPGHNALEGPVAIQDSQSSFVGDFRQNGKAGAVERGYRQKDGLPSGFQQAQAGGAADREKHCHRAGQVDKQYHDNDIAGYLPQAAQSLDADSVAQGQLLRQAGPLPNQQQHKDGGGHKAQAANQHQQENDPLPEKAPVVRRADRRMPGNGDRRGSGKESRFPRGGLSRIAGYRQGQQHAADQDQGDKAVEQEKGGGKETLRPPPGYFPGDSRAQFGQPGLTDDGVAGAARLVTHQ